MDIDEYLSNFTGPFPVAVNVNTSLGEVVKLKGTAEAGEPPELEVRFAAGELPRPDRIDTESDCLVFIEAGEIVTLICSISREPAQASLSLAVREIIQHSEKREFFRGPADRLRVSWRIRGMPDNQKSFPAKGVNISCGGILIVVYKRVEKKKKILLDMYLPDPVKKTISCEAEVLRVSRRRDEEHFVAARFTDLDTEHCDDIMAFCFAEQRRLLREQVITRDM